MAAREREVCQPQRRSGADLEPVGDDASDASPYFRRIRVRARYVDNLTKRQKRHSACFSISDYHFGPLSLWCGIAFPWPRYVFDFHAPKAACPLSPMRLKPVC